MDFNTRRYLDAHPEFEIYIDDNAIKEYLANGGEISDLPGIAHSNAPTPRIRKPKRRRNNTGHADTPAPDRVEKL
jgi:hypothetical protein